MIYVAEFEKVTKERFEYDMVKKRIYRFFV